MAENTITKQEAEAAINDVNATLFNEVYVPAFVKAAAAVVAPVPPLAISIVVALQTPEVIVPTLVKLDAVTLLAKVVPVKVFASAAMVISAEPSNAVPLMFLALAKMVAVAALPVVL